MPSLLYVFFVPNVPAEMDCVVAYSVLDVTGTRSTGDPASAAPASSATRHAVLTQAAPCIRTRRVAATHRELTSQSGVRVRRTCQGQDEALYWLLPARMHALPHSQVACPALPLTPTAQQRTLQELAGVHERRQRAKPPTLRRNHAASATRLASPCASQCAGVQTCEKTAAQP